MAVVAAVLARGLGFDQDHAALIRTAAPMHDVGKIGIDPALLLKPGELTPEERTEMQRHTLIGHALLADSQSDLLRLAATIALTHHEWYDGTGYPQGLKGERIPLEGRIVAVADVFDALLSDRAYRPAMSVERTVELIASESGTHFDPRIVEVLRANLDELLAARR
jgi:putative two-component system response regulator